MILICLLIRNIEQTQTTSEEKHKKYLTDGWMQKEEIRILIFV